MGAACCKECCGAIYEEELDALTDVVFDKFKDKRGLIPAAKAHEAARDLFKQYGGGLLPYIKSSQFHWQQYQVPGAGTMHGGSLDRYQFGSYSNLLVQGAKNAYASRGRA